MLAIGTVLGADEVCELVMRLHYRLEDFDEGDLQERIERHAPYILCRIPLDWVEEVWTAVDEDRVAEYAAEPLESIPPVVLGKMWRGGFDIIDGGHRVTVLREEGAGTVLALIPLSEWQRLRAAGRLPAASWGALRRHMAVTAAGNARRLSAMPSTWFAGSRRRRCFAGSTLSCFAASAAFFLRSPPFLSGAPVRQGEAGTEAEAEGIARLR